MKKPKSNLCMHNLSPGQELPVQQRYRVCKENGTLWVRAHEGPAPLQLNKGRGRGAGGLCRAELLHDTGPREASL